MFFYINIKFFHISLEPPEIKGNIGVYVGEFGGSGYAGLSFQRALEWK